MAIALALVAVSAMIAFAWVTTRARREWARSSELSPVTAIGISSLYVLAAVLTALALLLRPWPIGIPLAAAIAAAACLIAAGTVLTAVGARLFGSSARLYGVEAGGLIEGGIYRFTRNPQYAGLILIAVGVGVLGRSALALAVAALVAGMMWLWVALIEEPHLLRTFGSRYESYMAKVPRFLGLGSRRAA